MTVQKKILLDIRGESLRLIDKVSREIEGNEIDALVHILSIYRQVDELREWDGSLTIVRRDRLYRIKIPRIPKNRKV